MTTLKLRLCVTTIVFLFASNAAALEMTNRQVKLGPNLTLVAAQKATQELFKLDATGPEPILLLIGVRSGVAPAAMVVVDAIRAIKSKVYAVVQAEAFGPGAIVAIFCHKRYAFPHATFLFNKPIYETEKIMKKDPPLPQEAAKIYLDRVTNTVAKRLDMTAKALAEKMAANWFMSAAQAKKAGVIDKVVEHVTWVELVTETVEIKRSSTVKHKRPLPILK